MKFKFLRARPWGTALTFFAVGVLFASAMDWTPFSHAQSNLASKPSAAAVKSLGETSDAFVSIAEHVTPAVVAIQTRTDPRPATRGSRNNQSQLQGIPPELRQYFGGGDDGSRPAQRGTGSGFIITPDGYIVTNRHVVADADQITVVMTDRKSYPGTVVGVDVQTDVAVVKIDARNLPTVALGDDDKLRIGEWVLAIGNPLGLDFTVTAGIVSAKGRSQQEVPVNIGLNTAITDFIQTDAAINPGNSGGPLVNIRGEIVGINTAIASNNGRYEGYGFAIPVGLAKLVWQDLIDHGRVVRAQLGVSIADVTAEDADAAGLKKITGVLIQTCSDVSPACRAGVKEGDVITQIDGQEVDRPSALQRAIRAKKPGDDVAVTLMRFGKEMTVKVRVNEMAPDKAVASIDESPRRQPARDNNAGSKLGISVEPITDQFARANEIEGSQRGLQVVDVDQGGPSAAKLAAGTDVITNAWPSGDPIRTAADLQRVLAGKRKGDIVTLKVLGNVGTQVQPSSRIVNIRIGG